MARRKTIPVLRVRFWSKVDRRSESECWPWVASVGQYGYGQFRHDDKMRKAHRIAWELTNGPLPAHLVVCHHCDNPPCCNPAHLFVGSNADNMADMKAKGRGRCLRGQTHPRARLTSLEVRAEIPDLLAHGFLQSEVGKMYGVGQAHISRIALGKLWKR